ISRPYGLEAVFGRLSFDPDQTDRGNVAELVAHFERTRGDRNRQSRVTALHGHRDPLVRIEEDGALYLAIALHFLAIDRNYAVADAEAGVARRRILGEPRDDAFLGRITRYRLAIGEVEGGEDGDRDEQVGHRSRQHDQRALPQGLGLEGLRPLMLGQSEPLGARLACRIHVPGELDVAAERDGGKLPARAPAVGAAPQLPAEADREGV